MRPVFALALFLGVIFLGSIFAEEAFDCSNTTTCALPCTRSSNATKIFHWYIGETLSWNCTLGEKCPNATSADINFCFKGNVPDHLTRVVDSRTKELRIANVTEDYAGSYFCYVSGCLAADIEMQIAYPAEPPDVKVFYDVLSDMAQNLTVVAAPTERNKNVNWTWDIRYRLNTRRPQYFYDDFNDHCTEKKNWSCDSSLEFPCDCPESKFPGQCTLLTAGGRSCFEEDMNHTIHVKMSSTLFGSAHTNVNVIPSNAIARAPNVYDVCFNESSRQVEVRWSMWPGLSNMRYRVSYRRVGSEPWKESMTNETSLMIRGLVTNTPYQANISAKFDKSDIWSKPELKDFITTEDVPSESPKLSVGSYMHDVSPDCGESGQTSLVLYTKPIPKESENGKLLSIDVNVMPPLLNQTNPVESPVANQTIVLCGVRRDQDYEVELKGRTKMGLSKVPSSIVILSKAPLKPIQVVAEKLNSTTVHVRWTVQSDAMHNVTIHLCQQFDRHSKCLTGYDWLTVMGPVSSHNVTVANLDQTQSNFRFGVSVEVGGVSSGIAWSSCLYDRPSGTVSAHLSVPQLQACLANAGCGSNWVACVCP
ncbi:uncharacterized protein LOC135471355 [Liolophura sinensis]|uniref:uncharacterized protein LOC135471355 n=1 Tax=Liolophura sinensis TaxID=3198878 RepID=UPI0031584730